MIIIMNLPILIISFAIAYFLGWKLRLLIQKKNAFISVGCSVGVLVIFYIIKENLFLIYPSGFFHAIVYGLAFGLASGLGNSDKREKK